MNILNPKIHQCGVTLIEIMVSILVGLFILAGVMQLYATTVQNHTMVAGSSTIQENARLMFSRVEMDVSRAGYAGCLSFKTDSHRIQNIATQTTTPAFDASKFISGEDNIDVNGRSFDRFALRYAGSTGRVPVIQVSSNQFTVATTSSALFRQGDIVVVGDCSSFGIFRVSNQPAATGVIQFGVGTYNTASFDIAFADAGSIAPSITYLYSDSGAFQYYVGTSAAGVSAATQCSSAAPQYCALFRKSSSSSTADELVEGVQAFDVEYGWRNAADGKLFFAAAGGVPNSKWLDIDRVRITTTLNSVSKTATNEGSDRIERTYSRTFFFFNQNPGA